MLEPIFKVHTGTHAKKIKNIMGRDSKCVFSMNTLKDCFLRTKFVLHTNILLHSILFDSEIIT